MANAIRWMLDFARETAANPLLRARRRRKPWRFALSVALFLAVVLGAAWLVSRGLPRRADFPLIALGPLFKYQLAAGALVFNAVFLWNARDRLQACNLADLQATPLSEREIAVGVAGPAIAYGLLATLLFQVVACCWFAFDVTVVPRRGIAYSFANSFWAMSVALWTWQWLLLLCAYVAVHAWLLRPDWRGAARGFAMGAGVFVLCWLLSTGATLISPEFGGGNYMTLVQDRVTLRRMRRMLPDHYVGFPWLGLLLLFVVAACAFASLATCGPAAFLRSDGSTRDAGDCWRWRRQDAFADPAARRRAKSAQYREILGFWRSTAPFHACAGAVLLAVGSAIILLDPAFEGDSAFELAVGAVPVSCALAAAIVLVAARLARKGLEEAPPPALLAWTMRRLAVSMALVWMVAAFLMPLALFRLAGFPIFPPASEIEDPEFLFHSAANAVFSALLSLLLVCAVFPWGALPASRWRAAVACLLSVLAPIGLALWHGSLPSGWMLAEFTIPFPFVEGGFHFVLFRVADFQYDEFPLYSWSVVAALVLLALRFGGLYEILMQRYHDRHLAGLGPYDAPPPR